MKFIQAAIPLLAAALFTSAAAAQTPIRVRGVIEAVEGTNLTVKSREGPSVKVSYSDKTRLSFVIKAKFEDVKPGTYLGIAALPQKDSPQRALEVLIFPEAARGTGEGHRAWDLVPESTMTNATLSEAVSSINGQTITMKHKDGETKINISKDIPIVTLAPASSSDIKPGTTVFIGGLLQPDGNVTAASLTMGKDGVNPPM